MQSVTHCGSEHPSAHCPQAWHSGVSHDCSTAPQLWKAWKYRSDSEEAQTYYAVSGATRLEYATYYIVLLAFLAVMTHDVHEMVQAARVAKGF